MLPGLNGIASNNLHASKFTYITGQTNKPYLSEHSHFLIQVHYFTNDHEENKIEERIELGKNLNDGNWHGIGVERKGAVTVLKVDQESSTLQLADRISNLRITSHLYLGGIPKKYLKDGCKSMKQQFPRYDYYLQTNRDGKKLLFRKQNCSTFRVCLIGANSESGRLGKLRICRQRGKQAEFLRNTTF